MLGVPLIVLVSGLNVTPAGKPLTLFVTAWPLLSVASILIGLIAVLTSLVWPAIGDTVGAVVSWTVIVKLVVVSLPSASVVVTVIG